MLLEAESPSVLLEDSDGDSHAVVEHDYTPEPGQVNVNRMSQSMAAALTAHTNALARRGGCRYGQGSCCRSSGVETLTGGWARCKAATAPTAPTAGNPAGSRGPSSNLSAERRCQVRRLHPQMSYDRTARNYPLAILRHPHAPLPVAVAAPAGSAAGMSFGSTSSAAEELRDPGMAGHLPTRAIRTFHGLPCAHLSTNRQVVRSMVLRRLLGTAAFEAAEREAAEEQADAGAGVGLLIDRPDPLRQSHGQRFGKPRAARRASPAAAGSSPFKI